MNLKELSRMRELTERRLRQLTSITDEDIKLRIEYEYFLHNEPVKENQEEQLLTACTTVREAIQKEIEYTLDMMADIDARLSHFTDMESQ